MNINIKEFRPSPGLAGIVDSYWSLTAADDDLGLSFLQSCLPMGLVELIIHFSNSRSEAYLNDQWIQLPEAYLVGVLEKPMPRKIYSGTALFGVRFSPEGVIQLFRSPVSGLRNTFMDSRLFLSSDESSIIANIQTASDDHTRIFFMEAFLQHQLIKQQPVMPNYFARAVEFINKVDSGMSVDQLSKAVCISERQLQRSFKEYIGISPKHYIRIIRFRKAYQYLQTNPKTSMSGIASEFGFADQAHFIRDFKKFSGRTPAKVFS